MMDDRFNVNEDRVRADMAAADSLFGPPRSSELLAVPWDWRREVAKALLLIAEGLWMLAWAILFIQVVTPGYDRLAVLIGGWILLALLALLSAHVVMRLEPLYGWGQVRLGLTVVIVVSTSIWWGLVSGGPATFLGEIVDLIRLRPGPGFWALWLGILAWSRGFEWSQQLLGMTRARSTLLGGLVLLGILAMVHEARGSEATLVPIIGALWLLGLVALGFARLVLEDWLIRVRRPWRVVLKQGLLLASATAVTLLVARAVLVLLEVERRARISRWLLDHTETQRRQVALAALNLFILFVTLMWTLFFWLSTSIIELLGINWNPVPAPPEELTEGTDYGAAFYEWLATIMTPDVLFVVRIVLFLLFAALVLFYLLTKLDRMVYFHGQSEVEGAAERGEPGRLRQWLARLPRPQLRRRGWGAEPEDLVRKIYVRLVRLGADRGADWRAPRTPYEHESALRRVLPGHDADIRLITEQYVRVRYAGEAPAHGQIAELEAAWERLRRDTE